MFRVTRSTFGAYFRKSTSYSDYYRNRAKFVLPRLLGDSVTRHNSASGILYNSVVNSVRCSSNSAIHRHFRYNDEFVSRHVGPSSAETDLMLDYLGLEVSERVSE